MQIPVLIEPVAGNSYRATGGGPFSVSAEGATQEEALRQLRQLIESRLPAGAVVVSLDLAAPAHPWLPFAGMYQDHSLYDEWQQAIADSRERDDCHPPT